MSLRPLEISPMLDRTVSKREGQCRWFLLCKHDAVTEMPHPILGSVPICDRCLHKVMKLTDFGTYVGEYTMPMIVYRLMVDLNDWMQGGDSFEQPEDAANALDIPMGDLLSINGKWVFSHVMSDPDKAEWQRLGVDADVAIEERPGVYYVAGHVPDEISIGVNYAHEHMVIVGSNSIQTVVWLFIRT